MRVFRYLFAHKGALVLVVCLLMVQAFADLALPNLTSQIVDVGIQQAGIESAAVDEMSATTYGRLDEMLSSADKELLEKSYDEEESGNYRLNGYGAAHRSELEKALSVPLIIIHNPEATPEQNWQELFSRYDKNEITRDDLIREVNAANEYLHVHNDEGITEQMAVSAARAEYESLGYDLSGMQTGFFLRVGGEMCGFAALVMAASIAVSFIASRTGARIGYDLRRKLFTKVVSFTEREIERFSAASLITRGTNDIQLIQMVCIMFMRMVLYAPILAIGGIIMVMVTNASLGWIVVIAIICVFILIGVIFAVATPKFRIMQKLIDRVNLVAREMLSGIMVVRAFGRESYEQERFDAASTKLMRTQLFTNRTMTFMMPSMTLIMNLVSVAIVWFGGLAVDEGTLQTGDLIAFITYSMVIIMGFLMIGMIAIMLPRADVAARRVEEVLACVPSVQDPREGEAASQDTDGEHGAEVTFDHVTFAYDNDTEPVIHNVSFTAPAGSTLAIIGATGTGKSTILKLIERFHDVNEGSISIDGADIRAIDQTTLRGQIGYVPQKAFLFSGTVRTNVSYGDDGLSDEDVWEAIRAAQAAEFVEERDEGVNFPVAQGGTNVSGGQRQRLAIARALAIKPKVLLLDDCLSALDYKTDAAVRRSLSEQYADATKIIVAQRVSTIMDADQIVVLDEGHVVGLGTHAELLSGCDEYREIATSQLSMEELMGGVVS